VGRYISEEVQLRSMETANIDGVVYAKIEDVLVREKGQVTIPKKKRDRCNIAIGTNIDVWVPCKQSMSSD